ncbi:hypothetical protein BV898_10652 [Hypsibius exemplaris]|uniref:Protein quiver n=1 Tax=Hypsibius exemplaris TaxID=2072580 RepID=A0A1W0WIZ0_HYPEX|nr:hypothetical protein BV898_10652 [Hypsibius exemplaris]
MNSMKPMFILVLTLHSVTLGTAIRCYSCAAKYGPRLPFTVQEGPCWKETFNSTLVDVIECPGTCYTGTKDDNIHPYARETSVVRGCGSPASEPCSLAVTEPSDQRSSARRASSGTPFSSSSRCCRDHFCNAAASTTKSVWLSLLPFSIFKLLPSLT